MVMFGLVGRHLGLALFAALWPFVGASLIWTLMTQTSHVQEACHQDDKGCWTARQIAHSYDYSVHDAKERELVAALTAGLNMQSLHHALPTIAQSRLPGLYEEYAAIAARHGAAPRTSRNIATAGAELLGFVFKTNAPEPQLARS
jgi:fatty acid desaturase